MATASDHDHRSCARCSIHQCVKSASRPQSRRCRHMGCSAFPVGLPWASRCVSTLPRCFQQHGGRRSSQSRAQRRRLHQSPVLRSSWESGWFWFGGSGHQDIRSGGDGGPPTCLGGAEGEQLSPRSRRSIICSSISSSPTVTSKHLVATRGAIDTDATINAHEELCQRSGTKRRLTSQSQASSESVTFPPTSSIPNIVKDSGRSRSLIKPPPSVGAKFPRVRGNTISYRGRDLSDDIASLVGHPSSSCSGRSVPWGFTGIAQQKIRTGEEIPKRNRSNPLASPYGPGGETAKKSSNGPG